MVSQLHDTCTVLPEHTHKPVLCPSAFPFPHATGQQVLKSVTVPTTKAACQSLQAEYAEASHTFIDLSLALLSHTAHKTISSARAPSAG